MSSTVPVVPQDPSVQVAPPVSVQSPVADDRNMAMNAMLNQVAQTLPAVPPDDSLNPQYPSPSTKENPLVVSPDMVTELPPGVQSIEELRSAEISPEVEKYIEEVREEVSQLPKEVVVADQSVTVPSGGFVSQPVIVLPMTQDELDAGAKAPPTESKRWLAEWTKKIIKMFTGRVVFRES